MFPFILQKPWVQANFYDDEGKLFAITRSNVRTFTKVPFSHTHETKKKTTTKMER